MARPVKLLIACGSGIATSSIAAGEVQRICDENGIDIQILKTNMQGITSMQHNADIVLCTNNYKGKLEKPYLSVFGLIAGINVPKITEDLLRLIQDVQKKQEEGG